MLLGLPPLVFIHTLISLVALAAGNVVVLDLVKARTRPAWVSTFLVTAVATSATGFILTADRFLPSHATGIIALIVLAVALAGRYVNGGWCSRVGACSFPKTVSHPGSSPGQAFSGSCSVRLRSLKPAGKRNPHDP